MEMRKKHLWCPKCREYPGEVEDRSFSIQKRSWNGEEYELMDIEFDEVNSKVVCPECLTELEKKPQLPGDTSEQSFEGTPDS